MVPSPPSLMSRFRRLATEHKKMQGVDLTKDFITLTPLNEELTEWKLQLLDVTDKFPMLKELPEEEQRVDIEVLIPEKYPYEPPMCRVTYPELWSKHIEHGGFCFELLTKVGWLPSTGLVSTGIVIRNFILNVAQDVTCRSLGNRETRMVPCFSRDKAHAFNKSIQSWGESVGWGKWDGNSTFKGYSGVG